ncbi:MAG: hypothetical protein ACI35S_00715 [Anaeroplasma sp.]
MAETTPTYPLTWDNEGQRLYETGVKKVVLYLKGEKTTEGKPYAKGVAWNGVTSISESPSGAESTPLYANDKKYLNLISNEEYSASIEAYTYPDEFAECDGSAELATGVSIGQQPRKEFGYCYRTTLGNDTDGTEHGYKLHLVYNCLAAPSEKSYGTINDSPEAITFSWDISTTPVEVTDHKPTATVTIDSTKVNAANLTALEEILYGKEGTAPRLPLPDELTTLFKESV